MDKKFPVEQTSKIFTGYKRNAIIGEQARN